jgi:hypothetical protein
LGSTSAGFGVFLVEGYAFGFAHEGELDVDAVEEFGWQKGGIGCARCDGGEFGPVPHDESGVIDAKARIEERAGMNEIEEALLFRVHRPRVFIETLEEAEGFIFVVEFVGDFGDGGSLEKIYWFLEAGFESCFHVICQGDTVVTGGDFGERAKPFAEPKGKGFCSWFYCISGFGLLFGFHLCTPGHGFLISHIVLQNKCNTIIKIPRVVLSNATSSSERLQRLPMIVCD